MPLGVNAYSGGTTQPRGLYRDIGNTTKDEECVSCLRQVSRAIGRVVYLGFMINVFPYAKREGERTFMLSVCHAGTVPKISIYGVVTYIVQWLSAKRWPPS